MGRVSKLKLTEYVCVRECPPTRGQPKYCPSEAYYRLKIYTTVPEKDCVNSLTAIYLTVKASKKYEYMRIKNKLQLIRSS
jgi:hypothetical protein